MRSAYLSLKALNRALTRSVPLITLEDHLRIHSQWKRAALSLRSGAAYRATAALEVGWDMLHSALEARQCA